MGGAGRPRGAWPEPAHPDNPRGRCRGGRGNGDLLRPCPFLPSAPARSLARAAQAQRRLRLGLAGLLLWRADPAPPRGGPDPHLFSRALSGLYCAGTRGGCSAAAGQGERGPCRQPEPRLPRRLGPAAVAAAPTPRPGRAAHLIRRSRGGAGAAAGAGEPEPAARGLDRPSRGACPATERASGRGLARQCARRSATPRGWASSAPGGRCRPSRTSARSSAPPAACRTSRSRFKSAEINQLETKIYSSYFVVGRTIGGDQPTIQSLSLPSSNSTLDPTKLAPASVMAVILLAWCLHGLQRCQEPAAEEQSEALNEDKILQISWKRQRLPLGSLVPVRFQPKSNMLEMILESPVITEDGNWESVENSESVKSNESVDQHANQES
ncbi:uncharacterized protein [Dipodomys merriami]|uniref:uncharacterized protein n=1 Tax=Dipodomys merriami TaxID=94247 RepID=UPI003855C48A